MAAPMSDISGYRSDGGGLGQDQGVSKQLRSILTAKLPLLSAPGTVLENSLYYDINSSSVTAVEEQATFAKDRIALNNFTFGSTPSAYIPSVLFANSVFWIPQFNDAAVWPAGWEVGGLTYLMNIPQGWGFAALKNIIVYMGASSIAQIQISGMTNFLISLACCETKSKRNRMIEGAGRYLNPKDLKSPICLSGTVGQPIFTSTRYGQYYDAVYGLTRIAQPWLAQAVVPLRLPWSSMAVLDKRLSMDTKLSTQPIQITLQTAALNEFTHMGAGVAPAFGNQWKSSTLQLWQEELSDKSLSVRNELLAMPEFNVGYPFQYAQSIPFEVNTSTADVDGVSQTEFKLNITSIINSDLTTFLFNVTWAARQLVSANSGQYCPLYGEQLYDIQLLLNGQRFFAFEGDSYPFVTLAKQMDDPYYSVVMPSQNTTVKTGTYTSWVIDGNVYEFNNSRLRSIISESHLQNTARFTNQTFQLSFKIDRQSYYLENPPASNSGYNVNTARNAGYSLNMTYLYNAVYLVGGDGGTTKLITN
jgi:hypothetical protein